MKNLTIMFIGSFCLGSVISVPVWGQEAISAKVAVRIVSRDDQGHETHVAAKLRQKIGNVVTEYDTDGSGHPPLELAKCDGTVTFRVEPIDWIYSSTDVWKPCTGEQMVLYVSKLRFSPVVASTVSEDITVLEARSPGIGRVRAAWIEGVKNRDTAQASAQANEIAARLRQIGEGRLASEFGTAALVFGFQALGEANPDLPTETYLREDPRQQAVVMSPSGQQTLEAFQDKAGVPVTGKWDHRTFQALSNNPVPSLGTM